MHKYAILWISYPMAILYDCGYPMLCYDMAQNHDNDDDDDDDDDNDMY